MTTLVITAISRDPSGALSHVWAEGGHPFTVAEAITLLEEGRARMVVGREGGPAIEVVPGRHMALSHAIDAPRYLRSKPDTTSANNLDTLPVCPGPGPMALEGARGAGTFRTADPDASRGARYLGQDVPPESRATPGFWGSLMHGNKGTKK